MKLFCLFFLFFSMLNISHAAQQFNTVFEDLSRPAAPFYINDCEEFSQQDPVFPSDLFVLRMSLKQRLSDVPRRCLPEFRKFMRHLRSQEEDLETESRRSAYQRSESVKFFKEATPMLEEKHNSVLRINPFGPLGGKNLSTVSEEDFLPGDLLITRGVSFLSSTISQIGDGTSPFSHLVFITRDYETQKLVTVESYFGPGVMSFDFIYALKNENARILWLRPRDRELAKRASDLVSRTLWEKQQRKEKIEYDFQMDFENHDRLSCAEVGRWAYEEVSKGEVILPFFPSNIQESDSFLGALKLKNGPTFAPDDMEFDPRFVTVGEWSDLRLLYNLRLKDALMSKVLEWMRNDGVELRTTATSWSAGHILWTLRKTFLWKPLRWLFHLPSIPDATPRKSLEMLAKITKMGNKVIPKLEKFSVDFEQRYQRFPSKEDLRNFLEKEYKETIFKKYFRKSRKSR